MKTLDDIEITGTQISENIIFKGKKLGLGRPIEQNRDTVIFSATKWRISEDCLNNVLL